MYQGDVLIFNTGDGGEIEFVNGQPIMTGGFESMIFLCWFGGNFEDDGLAANRKTWWANLNEQDPDKRYISRLQNLIFQGVPLNSGNRRRIEEAALADLEIFKSSGIAGEVVAEAFITGRNQLKLVAQVNSPQGENSEVAFLINWQSYL